MQRIEDGSDEAPDRIGREADDHHVEDELPERLADQVHEAPGQIRGLAARLCHRDAQGEHAHDGVKNTASHIAESFEDLERRVGGGPLDRMGA